MAIPCVLQVILLFFDLVVQFYIFIKISNKNFLYLTNTKQEEFKNFQNDKLPHYVELFIYF